MAKFFMQHIGEALSQRDFPRSLGTPSDGYKSFSLDDVIGMSDDPLGFSQRELSDVRQNEPFQIWGLPEGAKNFTDQMSSGDSLMLLGSEKHCAYIGEIIAKVPRLAPDLSREIWGERKFAWIAFLRSSIFLDLLWKDFCENVGYSPNYQLRGSTSRLSEGKIANSRFANQSELVEWIRSHQS